MTDRFLKSRWAPLALAFVWLAFTIWARPLALPDEGRYVGVAWHMLTSGDWLTPRLDGLPYFHKPPLFYWITAASLGFFGQHEWAARIAPLIGATVGMASAYLFALRWYGLSTARLVLLALATQPLFFIGSQFANLDMLVAGCITATIVAFAHAALCRMEGRQSRGALAAGYLFMALGLLAKGLIGIVLPGMVLFIWLLARRQWRELLSLIWLPGFVIFLVVAGPWFVLMQREFAQFSYYFFYVQHFARFATSGFNNQQPGYFYPVVLGVLALPWTLWLFGAAKPSFWRDPQRGALRQLAWIWMLAIMLFFSLPASKLVGYILPATAPVALLAADVFAQRSERWRLWWRGGAVAAIAVCMIAVVVASTFPRKSSRDVGLALRAQMQPGDRVVFLQNYYWDLPFYGMLHSPTVVVDNWDAADLKQHDNWRKELADAAEFQPALGKQVLVLPKNLPAAYCDQAVTWVVGSPELAQRYPLLQGAQRVAQQGQTVLWRVAPRPAGVNPPSCAGTPIANSEGKS